MKAYFPSSDEPRKNVQKPQIFVFSLNPVSEFTGGRIEMPKILLDLSPYFNIAKLLN